MKTLRLGQIAYARSGDKGSSANIGVIARTAKAYPVLVRELDTKKVGEFFKSLGVQFVTRYEMPNLCALNFILTDILQGGGSLNPRIDAQGKALGQLLLEMQIEVPDDLVTELQQEETK